MEARGMLRKAKGVLRKARRMLMSLRSTLRKAKWGDELKEGEEFQNESKKDAEILMTLIRMHVRLRRTLMTVSSKMSSLL